MDISFVCPSYPPAAVPPSSSDLLLFIPRVTATRLQLSPPESLRKCPNILIHFRISSLRSIGNPIFPIK